MKLSQKVWYAHIAAAVCGCFADAKIPRAELIEMFWDAAESRSGFDTKYCDSDGRAGLFALPKSVFDEMSRRLRFSVGTSPKDPLANIEAAVGYIRWVFDKFSSYVEDERERLKIAFLSLDGGFFRTKFAIERCRKPVRASQVEACLF